LPAGATIQGQAQAATLSTAAAAEFRGRYLDHQAPEDLRLCAPQPLRSAALAAALDCG
jgi:hypothetical protein